MDELEKEKLALMEREVAIKEGELDHSAQEIELRREEMRLEEGKQGLERRRMWFVGIGVPVTLALVTALPTAINNIQNSRFQSAQLERELLIEDAKLRTERVQFEYSMLKEALSPSLSAEERYRALHFLINAGFISDSDGRLRSLPVEEFGPVSGEVVPQLPRQ